MTEIQKQAAAAKRDLNAEFRDYLDKWSGGGTDSAVAELKKHMESVRNGHRQQLREDHPQSRMNIEEELEAECKAIFHLLVRKNRAYGNSAAEPLNVLAQGTSLAQIAVRCDDKLKRIRNMKGLEQVLTCAALDGEDTVQDLIGYLILARVVARMQRI